MEVREQEHLYMFELRRDDYDMADVHGSPATVMSSRLNNLPLAALSRTFSMLSFSERCKVCSVCKLWKSILGSAAAHQFLENSGDVRDAGLSSYLEYDVNLQLTGADELDPIFRLASFQICPLASHARSMAVMVQESGLSCLREAASLTRISLLDPTPYKGTNALCSQPATSVNNLSRYTALRSLEVTMSKPVVNFGSLPPTLTDLHLNFFSGVSQGHLQSICSALVAAASRLQRLRRLVLSAELDYLICSNQGAALQALSALTQLDSLSLVPFQVPTPSNADDPKHQGYVGPLYFFSQLRELNHAEVHMRSGPRADLRPLSHIPEVCLHLTLEREETTPFNK